MNENNLGFFNFISTTILGIPYLWLFSIIIFLFFSYKKLNYLSYFIFFSVILLPLNLSLLFWLPFWALSILLVFPNLRQKILTPIIISLIKNLGLLPKISQTEKIALTSGTTWVDGELFSGNPDFKKIMAMSYPKLTIEEQNYIDNEVEELCKICVDYQVQILRDLPPEVWQFLRDKKFFGMIIPKTYGGLGFSAFAHSCIIEKLSSSPQKAEVLT